MMNKGGSLVNWANLLILLGMSALFTANADAAAQYELRYQGMSCRKVQRDSIAYPANEIFITTMVHEISSNRVWKGKHPFNRNYYPKVTAGSHFQGPVRTVWKGPAQDLNLFVSMWEHDDGGPAVDAFSGTFLKAAEVAVLVKTKGRVKVTFPDAIRSVLSARNFGQLFGVNNDLVGYHTVTIQRADWARLPIKRYRGIAYHFLTQHQKAGADCASYFLFIKTATATPTQAKNSSLRICNRTSAHSIDAAFAYWGKRPGKRGSSVWMSSGWYPVVRNRCNDIPLGRPYKGEV